MRGHLILDPGPTWPRLRAQVTLVLPLYKCCSLLWTAGLKTWRDKIKRKLKRPYIITIFYTRGKNSLYFSSEEDEKMGFQMISTFGSSDTLCGKIYRKLCIFWLRNQLGSICIPVDLEYFYYSTFLLCRFTKYKKLLNKSCMFLFQITTY